MDIKTALGLIAGAMTTASFLPQVIKTLRSKDTKSLSLVMYLVLVLGVGLWIVYGILEKKAPVIIANSLTLALSSIVLLCKIRYG